MRMILNPPVDLQSDFPSAAQQGSKGHCHARLFHPPFGSGSCRWAEPPPSSGFRDTSIDGRGSAGSPCSASTCTFPERILEGAWNELGFAGRLAALLLSVSSNCCLQSSPAPRRRYAK